MIAGQIALGLLYATALTWGNFNSGAAGAKAGAILGLLISAPFDFIVMMGATDINTTTSTLVDI
jgi:hypothetical protein